MDGIKLYEGGRSGGHELPDGVVALDRSDARSVDQARKAIRQRFGVDLGPLLNPRPSLFARLFG